MNPKLSLATSKPFTSHPNVLKSDFAKLFSQVVLSLNCLSHKTCTVYKCGTSEPSTEGEKKKEASVLARTGKGNNATTPAVQNYSSV